MLSASVTHAQPITIVDPADEDLLLLEVVLEGTVLADAVAAYSGPGGGTFLPLEAMSDVVGLAVSVDPPEGLATGFILEESRTFHLDVARREVTISGKVRKFPDTLVEVYADDIYVESTLLSDWLPITFDVDLFALRVQVRPREPLPLQRRLERERKIRHWRLRLMTRDPGYPRVSTGFRLWEIPTIDQTLRFTLDESESQANYSTYATGDLLFMESEIYLSGTDDDFFDTSRLTLRRRDPYGELGGRLGATEVALGHVIHPSSSLLTNSSAPEPGLLLTNMPLHRPDEFDRHSFRGNLPPGWDVELYHNGSLIGYQQSRPDGQYEFVDVPLLFGMNFFRLVFYGPQGQRREEEHRFLLGESLTLPGRFEYRLVANVESEETRRGSMLLSYGLNRHLTGIAEVASIPTELGSRSYGKLGLRTFWDAVYAYGDYVQDESGAHAWEGGLQTRLIGTNVLLNRTELSPGFFSQVFPFAVDPVVTIDRLRLDTAIPAWVLPRIPISLQVERRSLASGKTETVARNRISANYKGLSVSNIAVWREVTGEETLLEGSLQLSRYIRDLGVRGELLYTLRPARASTVNLTLERLIGSQYRVYANVSRSFLSESHIYSIGIGKTTGAFAAGLETTRRADGVISGNLNLSAGIGHEPREDEWVTAAQHKASFGAVSLRVFLDRNHNGVLDAADELLPRVGVTINGAERPQRSSESGILFVDDLSPLQPTDIAVSTATLESPQWIPMQEGTRIIPRPGKVAAIDVPIIETTEIEGTVWTTRRGRKEGLAGVRVELVDRGGEIVQSTVSAYDGFYVLTHVRPGMYVLRVSSRSAFDLVSTKGALQKPLPVPEDAPFVIVVDFVLPSADEPPVQIAEAPNEPERASVAESELPELSETDVGAIPRPVFSRPRQVDSGQGWVVQLGAFSIAENATNQLEAVRDLAPGAAVIQSGEYHIIRTGPLPRTEAIALSRQLEERGGEALVMRSARYIVQTGAFAVPANAKQQLEAISDIAPDARILRSGELHVVRTTAGRTRPEATALSHALKARGFDSLVMRGGYGRRSAQVAAESGAAPFRVQLGAFSIEDNALSLADRVEKQELVERTVVEKRGELYIVATDGYPSRARAIEVRDTLRKAGFEAIAIERAQIREETGKLPTGPVAVNRGESDQRALSESAAGIPEDPKEEQPAAGTVTVNRSERNPRPLGRTAAEKPRDPQDRPRTPSRLSRPETRESWLLHLAITNHPGHAEQIRLKASRILDEVYTESSGNFQLVRSGPYHSRKAAEAAREKLTSAGFRANLIRLP
ncbi:MAG: SPOR domain-containing protein [Acidobacteria bacterium]|nr:SPOR domain-containing protein [Acidobacteriota bacterium]